MKKSALLQRQHKPDIEPVLPLINVVFLLLIFFLMTGKLVKPSEDNIIAPSQFRSVDELLQQPEKWLYVDRDGSLTYRNEHISEPCELPFQDDLPLVIFADALLTGKLLNKTLAVLSRCNITDIAVVTEKVPA